MEDAKDSEKFRNFAIAFLKEAKEDIETAEELLENKRFQELSIFVSSVLRSQLKHY